MEFSVFSSFPGFISWWLALLAGIEWSPKCLGCPTDCLCLPSVVDCRGKNLQNFPSNIPLTTKELVLTKNNISSLPPMEINFLSELVYLDCSHNRLTVDVHFTLTGINRLIYLDLSFNRITYISHQTISQLQNLMLLNLSGNSNLTLIEKEAFSSNHMLAYLDLSGCGLQHIDADAFEHLSNLHTLGISNNPWRCDCALLEFCSWIEDTTIELTNTDNIICDEPKFFKGLQLFGKVQHELHFSCLVHLEPRDFLNMAVIAFCIFGGGMLAAWLVGISTVMYYHPTLKAHDDSEEEEHQMT